MAKDYVCKLTGRYVTKTCHVMAGRKKSFKNLIEVYEPRDFEF